LKTRFSRSAQRIARCRSVGVLVVADQAKARELLESAEKICLVAHSLP
jgi:organic hydroperoxide reductase OsmC/OhrA